MLEAKLKAESEYDKFRVIQDQNYVSDFDKEMRKLIDKKKKWPIPNLVHVTCDQTGKSDKKIWFYPTTPLKKTTSLFPTDAKLAKKIIDCCNQIGNKEHIAQRQSYIRVSKQLLRDT